MNFSQDNIYNSVNTFVIYMIFIIENLYFLDNISNKMYFCGSWADALRKVLSDGFSAKTKSKHRFRVDIIWSKSGSIDSSLHQMKAQL